MKAAHISSACVVALAVLAASCTMKNQDAPPLTGPSEFGTSVTVAVSPDVLALDGAAEDQSRAARLVEAEPSGQERHLGRGSGLDEGVLKGPAEPMISATQDTGLRDLDCIPGHRYLRTTASVSLCYVNVPAYGAERQPGSAVD